MARTTPAAVRALIRPQGIEIDDVDLGAIIATASTYVDNQLVDVGLDSALLIEIEKYLAAHFATLRSIAAGISSEREDDASVTYTVGQVQSTDALRATHFGQAAIALDVSGTLRSIGSQSPAFEVL